MNPSTSPPLNSKVTGTTSPPIQCRSGSNTF